VNGDEAGEEDEQEEAGTKDNEGMTSIESVGEGSKRVVDEAGPLAGQQTQEHPPQAGDEGRQGEDERDFAHVGVAADPFYSM
jgi:hypothetical protein